MQRRVLVPLGLALLALSPAQARDNWPAVEKALRTIQTAAGVSAFDRMESCRMNFQRPNSFVEIIQHDVPDQGLRKGDLMIEVLFGFRWVPGATVKDPEAFQDIVARWYVRRGNLVAQSGWAKKIQYQAPPLDWMTC